MPAADPFDAAPRLNSAEPDYPAIAIVGPTAAGKSAVSLAIAESLGGEVVNYDSVQIYQGFEIGSGRLREDEQRGIPHHLLGIAAVRETMTAGAYRHRAQQALESIRGRGKLPVLAGGTGLYLRSLTDGLFEGPTRSEEFRVRLRRIAARHDGGFLHKMLHRLDPAAASRIHPRDTQKVIRAVEVCWITGEPITALQAQGRRGIPNFRFIKIGLEPDRLRLYERINRRVESMFQQGLVEETRQAISQLPDPNDALPSPFQALGYRQAVAVLRGEMALGEAIRDTQAATRHYAKRQMTWFRGEPGIHWFRGFGDQEEIVRQILERLNGLLARFPATGSREPQPDAPLHLPERENS